MFSKTFDEHVEQLGQAFARLLNCGGSSNLKLVLLLVMMDLKIQSLHAHLATMEVRDGIVYRQFFEKDGTI